MNKKAQAGLLGFVIFACIVSGFLLAVLTPTLNDVRLTGLNAAGNTALMNAFYYLLIPIIWMVYLLFSVFAVIAAVNQTG